jgi:hypothetical protein
LLVLLVLLPVLDHLALLLLVAILAVLVVVVLLDHKLLGQGPAQLLHQCVGPRLYLRDRQVLVAAQLAQAATNLVHLQPPLAGQRELDVAADHELVRRGQGLAQAAHVVDGQREVGGRHDVGIACHQQDLDRDRDGLAGLARGVGQGDVVLVDHVAHHPAHREGQPEDRRAVLGVDRDGGLVLGQGGRRQRRRAGRQRGDGQQHGQ